MPSEGPIRVGLVFALMDEARPFIRKAKLKPTQPLPGYAFFEGSEIAAVVTGIGSEKAAAGTSALLSWIYGKNRALAPHQFFGRASRLPDFALVNIGLAGRLDRNPETLGRLYQIHCLRNQSTGESHFPDLFFRWEGLDEASLMTTARPVFAEVSPKDQRADLVDMEATAIMTAGRAFLKTHQMHFFKIASDLLNPIKNLRATTGPWLEAAAERMVPSLSLLAGKIQEPPPLSVEAYKWMKLTAEKLRFSQTRRKAWEQLCLRASLENQTLPLEYEPPAILSKNEQHRQWQHLQKLLKTAQSS